MAPTVTVRPAVVDPGAVSPSWLAAPGSNVTVLEPASELAPILAVTLATPATVEESGAV